MSIIPDGDRIIPANHDWIYGRPLEKKPRMESVDYFSGMEFCDNEALPDWLEGSMFGVYFYNHFLDRLGNLIYDGSGQVREILDEKELEKRFPCSWDTVSVLDGCSSDYTYASYSKSFPVLEEREATMSMIFVDGDRVGFSIDNTYKYQEWDELFGEMTNYRNGIAGRKGLHHAFVMYTDDWDALPVWTMYEKVVAGFIIDKDRKQLTAFPPESSVMIYHSLFGLWFLLRDRSFQYRAYP